MYSLFLGNATTFQFDQCNEAFCSEKSIEYDAPKSQLSILLEDSPRCTQELTFHCFMAPVMVSAIFVFLFLIIQSTSLENSTTGIAIVPSAVQWNFFHHLLLFQPIPKQQTI